MLHYSNREMLEFDPLKEDAVIAESIDENELVIKCRMERLQLVRERLGLPPYSLHSLDGDAEHAQASDASVSQGVYL